MRVAFNLEQLLQRPPGGVGRYAAQLARLLPGHRAGDAAVELVPFVAAHRRSTVARALAAFDLEQLEPARIALPRPLLYDAWHVLGAPRLGALNPSLRRVDLVHAPSLAVPPRGRAPIVVTAHDAAAFLFPDAYPRRGRWFHRRGTAAAARRADLILTVSQAAANELAEHTSIPHDRIRVVHHGVAQEQADADAIAKARAYFAIGDAPYVLWVGTLEPRKNLDVLVDAFEALVAEADLPHRLVIVGPAGWLGTSEELAARVRVLGERVVLMGPADEGALRALYAGAALFAFPSKHEGFGMPVLEAMAQHAAVVCADIPVLHEVAGDAARYADPDDAGAWAATLIELLRDDGALAALGAAGRARAERFTWERCIDQTVAVYREALGA
jgi:glycosyltransferase involved in cell wall biosynthesis